MSNFRPCADQVAAFYQCLVAQPVERWECDDDGIAAIREGFCDAEQQGAVVCVEGRARRSPR